MCGIVGYIGRRDSVPIILDALQRLEYRGYDSAGIAVIDENGTLAGTKAEGKLSRLAERLSNGEALSGMVGDRTYALGDARPSVRRQRPSASGLPRAHRRRAQRHHRKLRRSARAPDRDGARLQQRDRHRSLRAPHRDALRRRLGRGRAPHAARGPRRLRAGRDLERRPRASGFCSQRRQSAGARHRRRRDVRRLGHAGDSALHAPRDHHSRGRDCGSRPRRIPPDGLQRRACRARVPSPIVWDAGAAEKSGFKHFMLKEIFEQPNVIKETLAGRIDEDGDVHLGGELEALGIDRLRNLSKIAITGCGTAYHAGLVGMYLLRSLVQAAGRDGASQRVSLRRSGDRSDDAGDRDVAVGRDRRHDRSGAHRARVGMRRLRHLQRARFASDAARRRNALYARRPRDRRRGDEDLRLAGRLR